MTTTTNDDTKRSSCDKQTMSTIELDAITPPLSHFKPQCPPPVYRPTLARSIISCLSMAYIFICAYLGAIFMMSFWLPLIYPFPRLFKFFIENSMLLWFRLTEIVLAKFIGIHVRHYGDGLVESNNNTDNVNEDCCSSDGHIRDMPNFILMTNHRTRLDWFYFWLMGSHFHKMKICLKGELANIPGAGWAMQFGNFLFLKRRLELDKLRIRQLVDYLKMDNKVQIFIFPEGTDLSPEAMRRNAIYSMKTGKTMPQFTLHPRTSGIIHLINSALPNHVEYIYDVTVAYPGNFSVNEVDMITGHGPEIVDLLWRRIPIDQIPLERDPATGQLFAGDRVRDWIEDLWSKKEHTLIDYYAKPIGQRNFGQTTNSPHPIYNTCFASPTSRQLSPVSIGIFAYWLVYNYLCIYSIYYNFYARLYFFITQAFLIIIAFRRQYGLAEFISHFSGFPLKGPKET